MPNSNNNKKTKKAAYTESHRPKAQVEPEIVFTPAPHLAETQSKPKSATVTAAKGSSSNTVIASNKVSETNKTKDNRNHNEVRSVMTPRVVAVTSVTFLPEAARIMLQEDVGALPVVQEDGKLLGIITDRDITVRAVAEGRDITRMQVAECYTAEDLVTVTADTHIHVAQDIMSEHQVRRLPIVEGDNKLVGMVSLADIVRETSTRSAAEVLKDVSKPGGDHSQ